MTRTYTILGATGNVGKRASLVLLEAGHHVRAVVRKLDSPASIELKNAGATLVDSGFVKDHEKLGALYIDEKVLVSAFSDVDGIFLLLPPNLQSTHPMNEVDAFIELILCALKQAKNVKQIVFLSSFGAQHADGTGVVEKCYYMEKALAPLASSDLRIVFVRPGYFFSNMMSSLSTMKDDTFPYAFEKDTKIEMIDTDDIGDEVAKQLQETSSKENPFIVEISGPKRISMIDVADAASKHVGNEIKYVQIPVSALLPAFMSFGISELGAKSLVGIVQGIENGRVDFEHHDQIVRGKRSIADFLASNLKK